MSVSKTGFRRTIRKAALSVLCPTCGVKPGQRCRLISGAATSRAASGSTATRNQIQRTKGLTAFAALPCCAMLLERLTGHPTSGKLRAAFPKTAYQQIKGGCDVVL